MCTHTHIHTHIDDADAVAVMTRPINKGETSCQSSLHKGCLLDHLRTKRNATSSMKAVEYLACSILFVSSPINSTFTETLRLEEPMN